MKILFLARSLNRGGAERQLVLLAIGLKRRGHDVAVASFYGSGAFGHELAAAGVPLHDLGKAHRWDIPGFLWRLAALIRRERPDVLHGYLPVPDILAALLHRVAPGCRLAFGVRASDMDLSRYDRLAGLSYVVEARLARLADVVICNSEAGRRQAIARGFPDDRCVVIRNGIDTQRFSPDRDRGLAMRETWGVGEDRLLVGLVGRIDPMKGHDVFLRAAASARSSRPDLSFVCVGDGPADDKARLASLAAELDVPVIWAGAHDDMPAVYNALDLLVQPSLYGEGFPNVLAEGMACGLPTVASSVGDVETLMGGYGSLVATGDVEGIAAAILAAPRGPLPLAVEHIRRNFSVDRLLASTEEALR